ncbi:MAG: enoyl-ACP reductase [Cytophagales bacterium]|nr:enoyl-ACP reductase [Armatimonadota bacterium]
MGLLDGKKGLIYGVRNEWSIAWGCAQSLAREGATLALTYLGEREEKDVRKLAAKLDEGAVPLIAPCDLTDEAQVTALHQQIKEQFGALDFVIHCVAFAKGLSGRYVDVSYDDFAVSLQVSSYTLVTAARHAAPLMTRGGSIVTLTYIGGERVIPNYNAAGISKAALESSVRYLANDLGVDGIRVNAISAGPTKTLSGKGISGFSNMMKFHAASSPLRHGTTIDQVGDVCAFFVSDWSRGVTGDVLFVDSGYHMLGMPTPAETITE